MPYFDNRPKTKLRLARERLGLSREKTAVMAGISVAWLLQVERDPALLSPRVAARLLRVLGLQPSEVER